MTYFNLFAFTCVLLTQNQLIFAYPTYQQLIPNGRSIMNPCNSSEAWEGVGHELVKGQGPLNTFGRDFLAARKQWTVELCRKDSDGDGRTNGEELGDPNCQWTNGRPNPSSSSPLSHPGVCEPIESELCRGKNLFLENIDSCLTKLGLEKKHFCPQVKSDPSVKTLEIRFNQTVVPGNETNYMCQHFEVPADEDYHIIAWEMIIDNQELLHHMVLVTCNTPQEEQALLQSKKYATPEHCGMSAEFCSSTALVWAFGQPNRCYANSSGVLMGRSAFKRIVMQLHYNNPSHEEGVVDSSGIRIYYTTNRRPEHTAMIEIGQLDIAIPPGQNAYKIESLAFPTEPCRSGFVSEGRHYLSSMLFHMHQLGTHARFVIRKRNGTVLSVVDEAVTYDRPKFMVWEDPSTAPVLEAGDNLEVECTFRTSEKKQYTFFGEATADEMCLLFIEMFPRPQNISSISLSTIGPSNMCNFMEGGFYQFRNTSTIIDGCDTGAFTETLKQGFNSSEGFLNEHCLSSFYPAVECSDACRQLVEAYNWTDEACTVGANFRLMTALTFIPSYENVYKIQSQINACQQVIRNAKTVTQKSLSGSSSRDATTTLKNDAGKTNYHSFSIITLMILLANLLVNEYLE